MSRTMGSCLSQIYNNTNFEFYDKKNKLMGWYRHTDKGINFLPAHGLNINNAVIASVEIAKQYKQNVTLCFGGTKINIPYNQTTQNIEDIVALCQQNKGR